MRLFSIYYKLCHYRSTKNANCENVLLYLLQTMHKIISSRKNCGLFSSVFKKIIPYNTTPTFQEVGGVT